MKRFLSFLLVFWCLGAAAERFVPAGTSEGLGSRRVYRVLQDGEGYLWFFLSEGVDRYDGFEFRHYTLGDRHSERLIPSSCRLATGADGRIRCILTDGQVYAYVREKDAFELEYSVPDSLSQAFLYCWRPAEDALWLGMSDGLIFEGKTEGRLFEGLSVQDFAFLPDGTVLAGTETGLFRQAGNGARKISGTHVTVLREVGEGRFVVGTFSEGAFLYDIHSDALLPLPGVPKVPVRSVVRDGEKVYFGLDGEGVVLYDLSGNRILSHWMASDDDESLCANTVSDLCIDRRGALWVATTSNGICFLDRDPVDVRWIRHRPGDPASLASDDVSAVWEDGSGHVWFGTGRGLSRFSPSDGSWQVFRRKASEKVLAITETADGSVWAGGYGFPAFRIAPSGKMETVSDSLDYVFALSADSLSVWTGGLYPAGRFDRQGTRLTAEGRINVWDYQAAKDSLWAASSAGLLRMDPETGEAVQVPVSGETSAIWCLCQDGTGRLWMGQEGGMSVYDPDRESSTFYPLGKTVVSIVADGEDRVWAASDDILYRLDPSRDLPVVMNRYLGLGSVQFNHTATARLRDGSLVFGTADGALKFNPAFVEAESPGTVVPEWTGFRLLSGNQTAAARILEGKSIRMSEKIVIPYRERSFALSFSALSFHARPRVRFEYALEGHDPQARTSLTAATAEYPSVSPGHYVFRVRCVDTLTDEALGERALEVVVRRPLLLSTAALFLYGLLALGVVLLLIRNRRRQVVRQMTRERLDTFIRFAHELKTPVSLIKAPLSGLERDSRLPEEDRQSVSTAIRSADRLMSMINSLLDLRVETSPEGRLYVEPTRLRDYLEEILDPFRTVAGKKGIALSLSVADGLESVPLDREKMDRIVQNLVSNAVKYTSDGSVTVTAEPAGKTWRLVVKDTGIGIPAKMRSRIFNGGVRAANARDVDETGYGIGLMVTRQLVLQLGGSISLESEEGSGSSFCLLFPMEYRASQSVDWVSSPEEAPEEDAPAETVRSRILIVEDDPDMLSYLKTALSEEYETLVAPDGKEALRLAEEQQPDLVLSDVIMPLMNGYDLCRSLKSSLSTSHIPVILLTAMDDREHIILGLESGADDYVLKPFDPQVLLARIRGLLHERERLQTLLLRSTREKKRREYTNQLDREFMEKVLAVVDESCARPDFQVDDLCRAMAMSRTAFFNKLKAVTGKAPNDFIRIFRLERAAELLSTHDLTISEVADRVGFSDPKYFSACFRRHFGVSPSKY